MTRQHMAAIGQHIWVDGALTAETAAHQVPLLAHTLHYGVGAFEGIRAYQRAGGDTTLFRLQDHIARLFDSCKLVLMQPTVTAEQVVQGCVDVLRANQMRQAYLRPLCFMSAGSMGLMPGDNPVVTAIVAWEWGIYLGDDALDRGIRCKISSFTRHHNNSAFAKGKIVGQYVNSVIAKREAKLAGYDEALMLDHQGFVAEGSGENIFIVKNGELVTPPLSGSVLAGITRDTVLTLAEECGYQLREAPITRDQLYLADEVFLTGTAAEVTPVREVDDRPIGTSEVGPITRRLQQRYFEVVRGRDTSHPEWLTTV